MALAAAVGGLLVAGCAEEDHGPFRPPGGHGGGGSSQGGDAAVTDADGDAGGLLRGRVCIVTDLRVPDACPNVTEQAGVTVGVRGTAEVTTSGADGRFALPAAGDTLVLDVAPGSITLQRATVPVAVTAALVNAPVMTRAAWTAVEDTLGVVVPDGGGMVAVYVEDGGAPVAGVTFATAAGSSVAPFYDDGAALAWTQQGGTGAAGVALLVDVPAGTATLDGVTPDLRVARFTVPVVTDAITFVRVGLAAP